MTGELYNGEWKDGKRDGFGTFIANGYKYTGRWKDDKVRHSSIYLGSQHELIFD
jgi:hypothetical protein